jgi:hypothetical protein
VNGREKFEQIARQKGMDLTRDGEFYFNDDTHAGWHWWQSRQPEIDALKQELSDCHAVTEAANREIDQLKAEVERLKATRTPPAHSIVHEPFDAENRPDYEDGSMDWWQDAITNMLGAAHEHYRKQVENAPATQVQNSEFEIWQLVSERDSATEWADKLAHAIAERLGVDIGEHSNANNPWQEALNYCEVPAQENQWQQAVLNECMAIEDCYAEADPVGTVKCLIDWYVRNTTNWTKSLQEVDPHKRMTKHVAFHNGSNVEDKLRKAAEEVVSFLDMDINEEELVAGLKLLEGAIENLRKALREND